MATANETLISVKGLKKHFGKLQVLKGVDIDIHSGEVVVVIGPSGSGKSTFLRCINLLETPTEGDVIFEGKSVMKAGKDINVLRERIGMVFQQFNLFPHLTVLENICIATDEGQKGAARADRAHGDGVACARRLGGKGEAPIRGSFPADRSSAWPLCARWRWSRM